MTKILLSAAIFICSTAHGKEQQIQCPARYPANVEVLKGVPNGWNGEAHVRRALPLLGASFVEGPINDTSYAELKGDSAYSTKDAFEKRYLLDGQVKEKWIVCRYGNDGNVELFHRVAADATECVIQTKRALFPKLPSVKVICK